MSLSAGEIAAGRKNDRIGTELVHESDDMRVWHLRLAPGETIPPHRHDRPYFWTVLGDGKGLSCFDDGSDIAITYKAGDTRHFPDLTSKSAFVHNLTNTGETDLIFVTVEFKPLKKVER